ncbi:purine-binding chemotaxis protein CheW [Clostridium sp. YIM B02505]|uniref:Chemotaxis protein CheW n=1 Tax=Clostridium yunnanense TaxID=2800325 RepID=A0ABS1EL28_9CLOT|nr:chemotaxis protein CheW [Clostridium yunnanense]MBK1810075.1 purine-binding chemotaxis protein CheW [Clostridium yunnanense]
MSEYLEEKLDDNDTLSGKYITFYIEKEFYAIEVRYVLEIIGIQPITEIPKTPEYIKGIINLRGKIIPVMDVRTKFKKDFVEYHERTCVIVVEVEKVSTGLIVDGVSEVMKIDSSMISPIPAHDNESRYISGIGRLGEDIKIILDCKELINGIEIY